MQQSKHDHGAYGGRERLLSTARTLFRRHGASNVGINDVTQSAGVARMTLYNNFASKEALIEAVYKEFAEETLVALRGMETTGKSEQERIFALIDRFDNDARDSDYRGCPLTHASLQASEPEGPIYALVQAYKRALRGHILGLLEDGRADRSELADLILILLDGVVTEAYLKGVEHPASSAKRAIAALLQGKR